MSKISFRFYKDHEVRAIWDEEPSKWWFSVLDVVGAINDQADYQKNRNYWKYLKTKLRKEGNELVSATNQLKLTAADGKRYNTDVLDAEGITMLAKYTNNQRAMDFLDWFTYSDNTIDGQSRKKAYAFWESNLVADKDVGKVKSLQQIHAYLFGGLYDFAGKIRTKTISKGNTIFCLAEHLHQYLQTVENMPDNTFDEIVDKYVEMNMAHPFMEGNGRSTRIWLDLILKKRLGRCVDWSKIGKRDYLNAMIESEKDSGKIRALLGQALTDRIDDREIFMKGIDYSYYYEQEDGVEVINDGKEDKE
jgi:cell filamentation protein